MQKIEVFALNGVVAVFAVISLFAAARHGEGASYWGGLGVFAICIGIIFWQITRVKHDNDAAH